jgi:hypothetical protein
MGPPVLLNGYTTVLTAHDLVSGLVAVHQRKIPERFMLVELIRYDGVSILVNIQPFEIIRLADGSEMFMCITSEGKRVDIISPPPKERGERILTAVALIELAGPR